MGKVVCFGEIMMRLNPEGYKRFVQAGAFEASYAGGEANVAVSLANYGIPASYVTKVPAHEIGQCAVNDCAALAWIRRASCAAVRGWASIFAKRALRSAAPR